MGDGEEGGFGLNIDRRKMMLGLGLAATAGVTFAREPHNTIDRVGKRKVDDMVPKQIGPWSFLTTSGLVVPTEDTLSAALYSQLLTRVYTRPGDLPIMLLIAQSAGQTGILQIHRPEFCYPAGGFVLSSIEPRTLDVQGKPVVVNELTASMPGRIERIIYWTRVGNSMPRSWAQQRMQVAMDNLRGDIPDAVLIRLSTVDPDANAAFRRIAEFAEAMLVGMGPNRNVLLA